jgi:uncharacterized protein RhaS with RHS repeats
MTDANGHVTRYGYDGADRLTTVTGPDVLRAVPVPAPNNNNPRPPAGTTYTYGAGR